MLLMAITIYALVISMVLCSIAEDSRDIGAGWITLISLCLFFGLCYMTTITVYYFNGWIK